MALSCRWRSRPQHQTRKSPILFDQFVGAVEQRQRHGEAERLGGLEIDHQVELDRQLHWKIARLCSFQNLVDVSGCTAIGIGDAWPIADKSAIVDKLPESVNCR